MDEKKVAIIGFEINHTQSEQPSSYLKYLDAFNGSISYSIFEYNNLFFDLRPDNVMIKTGRDGSDLASYDAVMAIGWFNRLRPYEDTVHSLANYLHHHDVSYFNSEMMHRSKGKLSQYTIFGINKLPIPHTLFHHDIDTLIGWARNEFDYPFILKSTNESRGRNNFLISDDRSYDYAITQAKESAKVYCAQEYIDNDGDFRVLVMNNKVRCIIFRQGSEGSHLNNTSAGGVAKLIDINSYDEEIKSMAIRAANALGRNIGGVDIMLSKKDKNPYILEVNNMPQLSTGAYPEIKMKALNEMFEELL
jgi:RimK family alpha-L-glutamate ligase